MHRLLRQSYKRVKSHRRRHSARPSHHRRKRWRGVSASTALDTILCEATECRVIVGVNRKTIWRTCKTGGRALREADDRGATIACDSSEPRYFCAIRRHSAKTARQMQDRAVEYWRGVCTRGATSCGGHSAFIPDDDTVRVVVSDAWCPASTGSAGTLCGRRRIRARSHCCREHRCCYALPPSRTPFRALAVKIVFKPAFNRHAALTPFTLGRDLPCCDTRQNASNSSRRILWMNTVPRGKGLACDTALDTSRFTSRLNDVDLFAAEQTIFAAVRVQCRHRDARTFEAGSTHRCVGER